MKTSVSVPDDIFEEAEKLARKAGKSRSELFSAALREYVARHAPDEATEAFNRVADAVGGAVDEFARAAAQNLLRDVEW